MDQEKWMDSPEEISKAMEMVPIMEAFIKQVKAVVKEKLQENPEAVPGFKLRGSGKITSYEASEVAEILMSTNVIQWNDFLKACRYSEQPMVTVWADKRGISKSDARKDLKKRLADIAKEKPKSPAIIKDHG
jgi:gamma-glutamyl:cysteine ligase YbdK (ATP-grasp superfamily)